MRSVIEELWRGNLYTKTDICQNTPEMKELMGYISRHHSDLMKTMTDEQKEIFEKLEECWSEYSDISEKLVFTYAFKLGAQMAAEALTEIN